MFCEDYPSLKDRQITKMATEFPSWLGKLSDNQIEGMSFMLKPAYGSGAIVLRNLDDPSKYASAEFAAIAVDELTKNPKIVFDQFRSIIRWPKIDETKFLAGTNPGGIGHEWVKRMWIDRDFDEREPEPERFHFIQAFAKDNPHLSKMYVKSLEGLPEDLRKAYLDGDWNVFEGQYFKEWRDAVHTIEPFNIPDTWRRIRCIDHGRAVPTACLWGAIDYDGIIHWYREHYTKREDLGTNNNDADINAREIKRLSEGEKYWFTVMDSACFSKIGSGETIADIYMRNGVIAEPSPKDRLAGWGLMHQYLGFDKDNSPKMVFFNTCLNSIRTIPKLLYDTRRKEHAIKPSEDLDTRGEDHVADAISYALQYLHEAKSPKPKSPIEIQLDKWKNKHSISPTNLNKFYSNNI